MAGKTAIVTGGASGIGGAACVLMAEHGAGVIIADIDEAKGNALEATIVESGGEAVFQRLDVTSEADWDRVVRYALDWRGGLDIVVNNAGLSGFQGRSPVHETSVENWNAVFDVNSTGVFLGTKGSDRANATGRRRFHHQRVVDIRHRGKQGERRLPRLEGGRQDVQQGRCGVVCAGRDTGQLRTSRIRGHPR